MRYTLLFAMCCVALNCVLGQMSRGNQILYGNEWINHDQDYARVDVAEDGIYRVTISELEAAGLNLIGKQAVGLQLWAYGRQIPFFLSTSEQLNKDAYIEFYGEQNRSQLDTLLFEKKEWMLNPYYSNITDTTAYYFTYSPSENGLRIAGKSSTATPSTPEITSLTRSLLKVYSTKFYKPSTISNNLALFSSAFVDGTGFTSSVENKHEINLAVRDYKASGQPILLNLRIGSSHGDHELLITVEGDTVANNRFFGIQTMDFTFEIAEEKLSDSSLNIKVEGELDQQDRYGLVFVNLTYPSGVNFSGDSTNKFWIDPSENNQLLSLDGLDEASTYTCWDLEKNERIDQSPEGFFTLSPGIFRKLLILPDKAVHSLSAKPIQFRNFTEDLLIDYFFLTHKAFIPETGGHNYVEDYAHYRSSQEGGGFRTSIVLIDQLYEQFGFGINRHPVAIRNFIHFFKDRFENPKYFLIIGKGREYPFIRSEAQLKHGNNASFFIPTFGYPGSDNLLFSSNTTSKHAVPAGRLAISSPDQLRIYLEKVKSHERIREPDQTIENVGWKKDVLHLVGGQPEDAELLRSYMNSLRDELSSSEYAAKVYSFEKISTDPVQTSVSQSIFDRINNGTNLVTFFGHSSTTNLDFNINSPARFENEGRYPLLIALGCQSGNFHTSSVSIGEEFCYYEDKGFIASVASSHFSYASDLYALANVFYQNMGNNLYGESLGKLLQATLNYSDDNHSLFRQGQQFMLHGDPALKLVLPTGPDLVVDPNSIELTPELIDASLDSFDVKFKVRNLGKKVNATHEIEIVRLLPNGERQESVHTFNCPAFEALHTIKLPVYGQEAIGSNRLFITVDQKNQVIELPDPLAEENNAFILENGVEGFPFLVLSSTIKPVWPQDLGIQSKRDVVLRATTSNALAGSTTYHFQLDTSKLFNSPFLKEKQFTSNGGLISWQPPIDWEDEQVYYWRVSPDSSNSSLGWIWSSSSFVFLEHHEPGWNQSHHYQWEQNSFDDMSLAESGAFRFSPTTVGVSIEAQNLNHGVPEFLKDGKRIGRYFFDGSVRAGVAVVVINHINTDHWKNPFPPKYGSINFRNITVGYFAFPTETSEQRRTLVRFLKDTIPDGDYIYLSGQMAEPEDSFYPERWDNPEDRDSVGLTLIELLESEGAQEVVGLKERGSLPFVFVYQKGKGSLQEVVADSASHALLVSQDCEGYWNNGRTQSPIFGPSNFWGLAEFRINQKSLQHSDSFSISLYGYQSLESPGINIFEGYNTPDSFVDLSNSPFSFIQFELDAYDEEERTPVQLELWRTGATFNPDLVLSKSKEIPDVVPEGSLLPLSFEIMNLGDLEVTDTIEMQIDLVNPENTITQYYYILNSLEANATHEFFLNLETKGYEKGNYQLLVHLNPEKTIEEVRYDNNLGQATFTIVKDEKPPILDVTFDGRHISNRSLVSSKPLIVIKVTDENQFLPIEDQELIEVEIIDPNGQVISLDGNGTSMVFTPSNPTAGIYSAQLSLQKQFTVAGVYSLFAKGFDASGNPSSTSGYSVEFTIELPVSVSYFFASPNPAKNKVRFTYTLSGSQPLESAEISIYNVSGILVRKITQDEMNPLYPGENVLAYEWSLDSQFGSPVLPGIYFYSVDITLSDGSVPPHMKTDRDQEFSNYGNRIIVTGNE